MAEEELPPIVITRAILGLFRMQVCATKEATDEEILALCNRENPSGTRNGWVRVLRDAERPSLRPVMCATDPSRSHYLVEC